MLGYLYNECPHSMCMVAVSTRLGESLERWSVMVFLLAGILLSIATINEGVMAIGMETPELFQFAGFLGMIVSYLGLLGLYPRLADRTSQLTRVGLGLLFLPVVVIIIDLISVALGFGPPFGVTFATAAFGLFALGVALFGVVILRAEILSNAIGVFLFVYAIGWLILIGAGQLYGFPPSDTVVVISSALMAIALLGIGYFLRTEDLSTDSTEPGPNQLRERGQK